MVDNKNNNCMMINIMVRLLWLALNNVNFFWHNCCWKNIGPLNIVYWDKIVVGNGSIVDVNVNDDNDHLKIARHGTEREKEKNLDQTKILDWKSWRIEFINYKAKENLNSMAQ